MTMDDLNACMDKVSQEQTALRQDMRDLTAHTDHRLDRIEDMLRENNARANARVDRIETKIDGIVENVADIRSDIVSLKQDIVNVKQDVVPVKRAAIDRDTGQRHHITMTIWTAIGAFAAYLGVLITWIFLYS